METVRVRMVVEGRVQRVWFRESTRRQAVAEGVAGWVRNLPDGRVEAAFEGTAEKVETMCAWARQGPENALVTSAEEFAEKPEGLAGFEIQ